MNEFDRFVRHFIKPLAYIRYGDDFAVFCSTRCSAYKVRELATSFLSDNLSLTVNPKNDVVVSSKSGLKFLGHSINKDFFTVDRHTTKKVLNKLGWRNVASYRALPLNATDKTSLDWILLEKYVDV